MEKMRQMVRETAEKTAQKIVLPHAAKIDETGECPKEIVDAFGKQGFLALLLPEQYGGNDENLTLFCTVIEEIAKVSGTASLIILAQGIGTLPILLGGNQSQKDLYCTDIAEKNSLAALAMNEADKTLKPFSIKTVADKKGKDYILNGRKCFITNGSVAKYYSVFAATHPERGAEGISAFVAEKGTSGLGFGKKEESLGMKGTVLTDVIFEKCQVSQDNRLGEEGEGSKILMNTLNMARPAIGAQAVGIAQGALNFAIHYANERIQFGKPISSFQAIQFMIADMATQIETARALVYKAAAQIDEKMKNTEKLSAISKIFASEAAMKVTTDAVQILGGYGYMREYPLERMMRDAKFTQVYEEPNQIERFLVAQELFKG